MKKLSFGRLMLSTVLACLLVSCQKETTEDLLLPPTEHQELSTEPETLTEEEFWESMEASEQFERERAAHEAQVRSEINTDGLSVQNGVLVFESIEYYQSIVDHGDDMTEESPDGDPLAIIEDGIAEQVIEAYVRTIGFDSYGSIVGENSEFDDGFIDAILNEDRVVQIENWLIKINVLEETVWTIAADTPNAYQNLLSETGTGLESHSTGDDVLYQLQPLNLAGYRGCGGIGSYSGDAAKPLVQGVDLYSEVRFRRYGIYFRLRSQVTFGSSQEGNYDAVYCTMQIKSPIAWRKRRPCGKSKHIGTHAWGDKTTITSDTDKITWTFYSSSRNLNGYYMFVRARGVVFGYNQQPGIQWAFTNWRGQNKNSPY
ncbi:MAG: hypothetical protein AAFW73_13810 [Bacteroidota bacterium]